MAVGVSDAASDWRLCGDRLLEHRADRPARNSGRCWKTAHLDVRGRPSSERSATAGNSRRRKGPAPSARALDRGPRAHRPARLPTRASTEVYGRRVDAHRGHGELRERRGADNWCQASERERLPQDSPAKRCGGADCPRFSTAIRRRTGARR